MAEESSVPNGAAVFPIIPAELGVDPLLLATIHAAVFLDGSAPEIVNPDAAGEALEYLASYLQRLDGPRLERVREDLACLTTFAKQQKWPKAEVRFLQTFLQSFGVQGKSVR